MNKDLISKMAAKIKKGDCNFEYCNDFFSLCRNVEKEDFKLAHEMNKMNRETVMNKISNNEEVINFFGLYKKTLLFDAPYDFDSYMLYIEINRKPNERFYQPRRRTLKVIADSLQELVDDELDELFISMPPRIGKTTILLFFVTWLIGRNSEKSNLYSAFSDIITSAFYSGVLEIINDPVTYLWHDVFPDRKIASTNSKDETLNLDRKKRYPSLTCRSLYGTLNGACDSNGVIISDDLIGGIEEALNRDRLDAAWYKVDNNLIPRGKERSKLLWCGTRWSIVDPAGRRMALLQEDERFKNRRFRIINLPAVNEDGESNFNYSYDVGFSTEYYQQRKASFERNNDMASWMAQYMGQPIEREGTLFLPLDFRYFNGVLPDGEPDRIFMPVDPAYGGGDFVAAPVCVQYNEDIFVVDVVYDNSDKKITVPLLARAVEKYNITAVRVEASKSTMGYKDELSEVLKERGLKINLTTKAAPSNTSKAQRIFDKAPNIRENMVFLEPQKRSKSYEKFMQNVFSFKIYSKNKHDDAPDSLSMAVDMAFGKTFNVEVFKRLF